MLGFALFGAGRIGRLHAENLAANPRASLVCVYDAVEAAAREAAEQHGARVATSVKAALADSDVDAVLIASSTDTHVDLITAAVSAGKPVLCEKPIDLDVARVNRCGEVVAACGVPVQIGFNRRFDPNHRAVYEAVRRGEVGRVELVIISSRDSEPPPIGYLKVSGGLFRDMMIHDFDMARFLLDQEPVEVTSMASALVDATIADIGDVDTAMVTLRTASGALCHINNSRRSVYGYDQRVEVFGERGMVRSDNLRATSVDRYTSAATEVRDPLLSSFLERYVESYRAELEDFIDTVGDGRPTSVSFEDGRRALLLANAAVESLRTGRIVKI